MNSPQSNLAGLADANALPASTADTLLALAHRKGDDALPQGVVSYEIGAQVGTGAMATVVVARHPAIRRDVAMKRLSSQSDEATRLRFIAEAQITGQLEHPNIVPLHELAFDENGEPYYTMKFVHGRSVAAILDRLAKGDAEAIARYPLAVLLTIFQKICDAVAFAHSRGVIHRDLKPANVMVGDYGEVVVMDWGVAKVLDRAAVCAGPIPVSTLREEVIGEGETLSGTIVGTPHYMPPEQARGESDTSDERADIYSLGAILFHMLTLRPAVQGETPREIIGKVAEGQVEHITTEDSRIRCENLPHLPDQRIPESLAAVVRRAMAFQRADRYQSVPDLQREVSAYQRGFATEAEKASLWKHCALFIGRHRISGAIAAVSLGIVAVVSTTAMVHVIRERDRAEHALKSMRKMAPVYFEQSCAYARAQHFQAALAKIDTALLFLPDRADFHSQRGNVLQMLRRFDKAQNAYLRALTLDPAFPHARENAALSGKLATLEKESAAPSPTALIELENACRRQKRTAEADALAIEIRTPVAKELPQWREHLRQWLGTEPELEAQNGSDLSLNLNNQPITSIEPLRGIPLTMLWMMSTRVQDLSPLQGMRIRHLVLSQTPVTDLSPLRGLPISTLRLARCWGVSDLTPLAGMPLVDLSISGTRVTDLSPLRGTPLHILLMGKTPVSDLTPLEGMPLEQLVCGSQNTLIASIEALRGMPLRSVNFGAATKLPDLRPLEDCRKLEEITLPFNHGEIEFLRRLPRLKKITRRDRSGGEVRKTAAEFWTEYDRERLALKK